MSQSLWSELRDEGCGFLRRGFIADQDGERGFQGRVLIAAGAECRFAADHEESAAIGDTGDDGGLLVAGEVAGIEIADDDDVEFLPGGRCGGKGGEAGPIDRAAGGEAILLNAQIGGDLDIGIAAQGAEKLAIFRPDAAFDVEHADAGSRARP